MVDTKHPGGPQYKVHTQKRGQLAGGCRHKNSIDALFRCFVHSNPSNQMYNRESSHPAEYVIHIQSIPCAGLSSNKTTPIFNFFHISIISTYTHMCISNVMTHQPNGPLLPISSTSHLHTVERKEKKGTTHRMFYT